METSNPDQAIDEDNNRLCDYCNHSTALLYCRADSAKLCFSCDRQVHSTNQLFCKHSRSQLCDSCFASPAFIFCETERSLLCQACDWDRHGLSLSSLHNRRPVEGFTGCPNASELLGILGFDDIACKTLLLSDDVDSGGLAFDDSLDFLVWDTPVVSMDDLIASTGSGHHFQAMGVPPLPKNRNASCGQHKEEILHQLRELVKLEPNLNYVDGDFEPIKESKSLETGQVCLPGKSHTDHKSDAQQISFPPYKENGLRWLHDNGEGAPGFYTSALLGNHLEENHVVPVQYSDSGNGRKSSNAYEGQSSDPIPTDNMPIFPKFPQNELNSQERDSALSRYKEKKKTRRYDKHIRYESRKVRAENRTRIRGRFAKMEPQQ